MQPQHLVDDGIQMLGVLELSDIERLAGPHQGIQVRPKPPHERWVLGEIVEDVREHDGDGVAARDDDQARVAVQPFGGFDVGSVRVRLEEPGRDVGHLRREPPSLLDLVGAPADEAPVVGSEDRRDGADGDRPGDRGEETKEDHGVFEPVDGEVHFARLHHVEGLGECKVPHDVEGVVVEPS